MSLKRILLIGMAVLGVSRIVDAGIYETEKFKYIPQGAPIMVYDLNGDYKPDMYWWDKNKDGRIDPYSELFFDLNGDFIPDMNFEEFHNHFKPNSKVNLRPYTQPIIPKNCA